MTNVYLHIYFENIRRPAELGHGWTASRGLQSRFKVGATISWLCVIYQVQAAVCVKSRCENRLQVFFNKLLLDITRETQVLLFFFRNSAHPALCNCDHNPTKSQQFVDLKNLKVLPRRRGDSPKQERLLLREFRLQKWATFSEDDQNVTKSLQNFPIDIETSLQSNGAIVTSAKSTKIKSMQDRAISNALKIQTALNLKNSIPKQKQIDHHFSVLDKSADSGVWCDLTLEREEKTKTFCNSNESTSNPSHTLKQKSQNQENFFDVADSKSNQTTPEVVGSEGSSRPPIAGCTWWQNSTCLNFSSYDGNQPSVYGRHSVKVISPRNGYHRLYHNDNSCLCMSPGNKGE